MVCGAGARNDIRRSRGKVEGKGMATAGLIMGCISVGWGLLWALLLLSGTIPWFFAPP